MSARKTILIFGASGAQGGSVANHLLRARRFDIRCLTRHPTSEKSANLKQVGAQVVHGDLDDPASLSAAMHGCWGVFGVTNYWEHYEQERQHGINLVNAVASANPPVQHFIFSTLPPARRISGGKVPVPHFDIKAELEDYARGKDLRVTFTHVAYYFENFLTYFPPRPQLDGTLAFGFPQGDTPLAGVAVEDIGGVVAAIFDQSEAYIGKTVGIVGDDRPPAEYADVMSAQLGRKITYQFIPRETFAGFGFPGAEDLANMFEFNRLYIPNRKADLEESRRLYPPMQTFEQWLGAHKDRLRQAVSA